MYPKAWSPGSRPVVVVRSHPSQPLELQRFNLSVNKNWSGKMNELLLFPCLGTVDILPLISNVCVRKVWWGRF